MRRKATWGLLAVTFAWGATFIWMKQYELHPARNRGIWSNTRCCIARWRTISYCFHCPFLISKEARSALRNQQLWKGGAILGGILLVGFITQMIGLDSITPSTSAFLTSLYVVFTALITTTLTGQKVTRTMILGVALATLERASLKGHLIYHGAQGKFSRSYAPSSSLCIFSTHRK